MQSHSFAPNSPFAALFQNFGARAKTTFPARPRPAAVADTGSITVRESTQKLRAFWHRSSHFFGDSRLAWATAGNVLSSSYKALERTAARTPDQSW